MEQDERDMSASGVCSEFEPRIMLFAAGELDAAEIAEVNDHLLHCAECYAALARENELLALLSSRHVEPDAALLAGCRASLEDALDQEEERGWLRRKIGALVPFQWIAPAPAWSAALLLLTGFAVGILGPRLLRHPVAPGAASAPIASASAGTVATGPDSNNPADTTPGSLDLHSADVAGLNVFPSGDNEPPQVELQLRAQRPLTLQGTVKNHDVKQIQMYKIQKKQRFGPHLRQNAVDHSGADTEACSANIGISRNAPGTDQQREDGTHDG